MRHGWHRHEHGIDEHHDHDRAGLGHGVDDDHDHRHEHHVGDAAVGRDEHESAVDALTGHVRSNSTPERGAAWKGRPVFMSDRLAG
jgi:hypothetical protein